MQCAGIVYNNENSWTYLELDVTPCTVYSVQCTVVHSGERAGPQLEGKQVCWAAEDQPGEHLQELLSLYVEQSPSEYTYCPGTCRH